MDTSEIKKLVPEYCDTITTKEIAKALGVSTQKAYALCCEAEKEGWLYKYGYKVRDGYEDVNNSTMRLTSLTWQNVSEDNF